MIADLKPYPAMKRSGVPWLGEVPEHWEVRRLKQAFRRIVGGSTPTSTEAGFWDGDVVWVTPADVSKSERLRNSFRRITRDGLRSCSTELVPQGSIVVTSRAPVGNVALAETDLCTNQGCKTLVITDGVLNPEFGFHVLKTLKAELQSLATGTTFAEISTDRLGSVVMPLPSLTEQASIVRFLDHADRRVRLYIRAKQKLIKLLEEQRQAIIHRAVTRGLDPNVRLKPSGVEWLGDVPEHWRVSRIKAEFECLNRSRVPLSSTQRGTMTARCYDYYGASSVIDKVDDYLFDDELLLIAEDGANLLLRNLPLAIIARGRFWVNNHAHILKPKRGNLEYMAAMMEGLNYTPWISGAAQPKLTQERLMSIAIAVPAREEQDAIITNTGAETSILRAASDRANREVALFAEYRTRLIADVVTGKLDVREAAARLPEEAEEPEPVDESDLPSEPGEEVGDEAAALPEGAEA